MSTVILDTITGKSTATTITIGSTPVVSASANSMTIRGEGSAQTSIQQGLCKCWAQVPGAGTSIFDSFNVGSITDTGTGVIRFTYTSNMVNTRASFTMGHQYTASSGTGSYFTNGGARATSSHDHNHYQNGSLADPVLYNGTVHGDLA
tara:strand:+ start:433 stop:876 length:444 start_codon:yes stop_codon:yes gene_type:complete